MPLFSKTRFRLTYVGIEDLAQRINGLHSDWFRQKVSPRVTTYRDAHKCKGSMHRFGAASKNDNRKTYAWWAKWEAACWRPVGEDEVRKSAVRETREWVVRKTREWRIQTHLAGCDVIMCSRGLVMGTWLCQISVSLVRVFLHFDQDNYYCYCMVYVYGYVSRVTLEICCERCRYSHVQIT